MAALCSLGGQTIDPERLQLRVPAAFVAALALRRAHCNSQLLLLPRPPSLK